MKTLIGIDGDGLYRPALCLLGRLRLLNDGVTLAHVERPTPPQFQTVPLIPDTMTAPEIDSTLRALGRTLLEESAEEARDAGLGDDPRTIYRLGNPAATLMDLAGEEHADLVAIGARPHSPLECFLLGSVGRALAIAAHSSFLVARGRSKNEGPVTAVFATDHSAYANRCFARLLDMRPEGLGHVTIVTATESTADLALHGAMGWDDRTTESVDASEQAARRLGEGMVGRLTAQGISAEYRLVEDRAEEALRQIMEETGSDLLILGSRGHGMIERVLIGSLALHAVVAESYSVLVVRMPDA